MKAATLALLLAAAGCGPGVEPCDIGERQCQEDVYYTLLRHRGDGVDPFHGLPPIERITAAEHEARVRASIAASAAPAPTAWDTAFRMLRLIESPTLGEANGETRITNVAAYYSSATKMVTIIDRYRSGDDLVDDMSLLAHEFVHAVQDRELDLQASTRGWDASLARSALVEGEAVLYETLADAEFRGFPSSEIRWADYFRRYAASTRGRILARPNKLFQVRSLVYPLGGAYLTRTWQEGGNGGVHALHARAPAQTLPYLQGYDAPAWAPIPARAECPGWRPTGFEPRGGGEFGAFILYAYLLAAGVWEEDAFERAKAWRGDHLSVYQHADGSVALTWHIQLFQPWPPHVVQTLGREDAQVQAKDNEVLVSAVQANAWREAWAPVLSACR